MNGEISAFWITFQAVEAARKSFEKWSLETTAKQRSIILRKWFEILTAKEEELGKLLTLEQGKPLAEGKGEIAYSAAFIDWYSGEARRIYGQVRSFIFKLYDSDF